MQSTEFDLDLDWRRDAKGYRLKPEEAPPLPAIHPDLAKISPFREMKPGSSLLGGIPTPERIERRGGRLTSIRPTAEDSHLYLKFSQVRTAQELLAFVNAYGFLTKSPFGGPDDSHYETVADALKWAEEIRGVIRAKTDGSLDRSLSEGAHLDISGVTVSLGADRLKGRLRFQFKAKNLLQALRFQLSRALVNGTLRECLECGAPFEAGIGTGRRLDAKFCSDAHREARKSRKRSEREG